MSGGDNSMVTDRPRRRGTIPAAFLHSRGGATGCQGGMEAVVELPEWAEVLEKNPENRQRFLDLDPRQFIETLERWMLPIR